MLYQATCPPLPDMPALKLPGVPGDGRRVAGGEYWNDVEDKKTKIRLDPPFHHSIIPIVSEAN